MELVIESLLIIFLLLACVALAMSVRKSWHNTQVVKKARETADMNYAMTKDKYETWLKASRRDGYSE